MSVLEMKVPSPGESITEVEIASWLVSDGDYVEKDQAIAEVDSDKATLELPAEDSGIITLKAAEGDSVKVGQVVCLIDTSAARPAGAAPKVEAKKEEPAAVVPNPMPVAKEEKKAPAPVAAKESYAAGTPSIAAKKIMDENNIPTHKINGSGKDGRITKQDVLAVLSAGFSPDAVGGWGGTRDTSTEKMSMLRRKIASRLVSVKNETAMLTTFNEVDMKPIMDLRNKYKDKFKEKHGVNLGFMSFFTKACTEALNLYPQVNSMIDGDHMIAHNYADIGIAVSSPKGLMVPVLRNAERMTLAEIEGRD
jgi:2-oxoglutarate dehydrogenase E2 component (dihydrolipoamide succinyltransferase)